MIHPSFVRLRAYVACELDGRARARVASHLLRCPRCRVRIEWIHSVRSAAAASGDVHAPEEAWQDITHRMHSGEAVLLPAAASERKRRPRVARVTFAALIAAVLAAVLLVPRNELEAVASELHILGVADARRTLPLRYRPTSELAREAELIVRARYFTPNAGIHGYHAEVGRLRRAGSYFDGVIQLPDSAVYAILAVENANADVVDVHGESWDVLVHGTDGKPLYEALVRRMDAARMRDTRVDAEVARELTRLYPDHVGSWLNSLSAEVSSLGHAAEDSVRAAHRPRALSFERALTDNSPGDAGALASLAFYAGSVGDTALERRVDERLVREFPTNPATVQRVVLRLRRPGISAQLAALDSIFDAVGGNSSQLLYTGLETAKRTGDAASVRRWGERYARGSRTGYVTAALEYLEFPELRGEGILGLRRWIDEVRAGTAFQRPLNHTTAEFKALTDRALARNLTTLGHALLAENRVEEALAALREAGSLTWDPTRFYVVGNLLLAQGNRDEAMHLHARAVADPSTPAVRGDSIRAIYASTPEWPAALDAAASALLDYYHTESILRYPALSNLNLHRLDGTAEVIGLKADQPTLIVLWSRYCPPAVLQLADAGAIARRASASGIRVLSITDDQDTAAVRAFMQRRGITMPVYIDRDGDARTVFGQLFPRYIVLDREGRIRFMDYTLDGLEAKLLAVRTID